MFPKLQVCYSSVLCPMGRVYQQQPQYVTVIAMVLHKYPKHYYAHNHTVQKLKLSYIYWIY